MRLNNLNMAAIGAFFERARTDPGAVRLQKRVEGTWSFAEGTPQFSTTITHGDRETTLAVDMAPPFGGAGLAPDPLQYMLAGLGACYAATLVTIASMEGVSLSEVKVVAESRLDVSTVFGLAERPLVERVSVRVSVNAPVDDATLARWEQAAREKCPFAFTVANAVPLETVVARMG